MNSRLKVLLFEKATFLVIAQAQRVLHDDIHRFEKVSNIIKQFKLSCRYLILLFLNLIVLILAVWVHNLRQSKYLYFNN